MMTSIIEYLLNVLGVFIVLIIIDYKREEKLLKIFTKEWFYIMFLLLISITLIKFNL